MTQHIHISAGRPFAMTLGVVDTGCVAAARPEEISS
jgi:hypothetical protein